MVTPLPSQLMEKSWSTHFSCLKPDLKQVSVKALTKHRDYGRGGEMHVPRGRVVPEKSLGR